MRYAYRRIGLALVSTVLRWPLWGALFLARAFVSWRTLFVVYPGHISDVKAYSPDKLIWLRDTWLFRGKPQFAGIQLRRGARGAEAFMGIVVYISSTTDEMSDDKRLMLDILRRLRFLGRLLGTEVIACAGQIPSLIHKHGIELERPFIDGRLGSSYAVISTVIEIYRIHDLHRQQNTLVLVGIGFLGKTVMENLQAAGYRVRGIDIEKTRSGIHIGDRALETLAQADAVVVLTPRGEDFLPYLEHLKPGTIIIDDTHPRLRHRSDLYPVYRVALEWPGFEISPRLPGFKKQWIPGCMVEAIVKSRGEYSGSGYGDFSKGAQQAAIEAMVERSKKT